MSCSPVPILILSSSSSYSSSPQSATISSLDHSFQSGFFSRAARRYAGQREQADAAQTWEQLERVNGSACAHAARRLGGGLAGSDTRLLAEGKALFSAHLTELTAQARVRAARLAMRIVTAMAVQLLISTGGTGADDEAFKKRVANIQFVVLWGNGKFPRK